MFSIAALLTQWVPTIVHAISTGKATLDTLRADFNAGTPTLTPEQRVAGWAAIIQHDTVKAAIHHAAAGEDADGHPLPPANAQVGTQLRELAGATAGPLQAPQSLLATATSVIVTGADPGDERDAGGLVEPAVTAGDVGDAPAPTPGQSPPIPRPNRTQLRSTF